MLARKELTNARAELARGIDLCAAKQQQKAIARSEGENTFEVIAREWLGKQALSVASHGKALWMFEKLTFPWIGDKPIDRINSPDMLALLRRIESRGKLETAQRVKQQAGRVFR